MVLTDSRADYCVLKNMLQRIQDSEKLELYMIVTGAHVAEQYGHTVEELEGDGIEIWKALPISGDFDERVRIPLEMSHLLIHLSGAFCEERPDILVLLGDRYEMLAAALVAVGMHIPIAHISGGESTEGAMDEQIRHAITKMAHIHFPGAAVYADNIKKMGEEAWRIFDVGDPGIENIKSTKTMKKSDLENELKIKIDKDTLLVTYHPVTLEADALAWQMANLISALADHTGSIVITYPNSDDGSELIIRKWKEFANAKKNVRPVQSLGNTRYISLMGYCGALVGNSSSAIIEAPFIKVAVVNIGNRQKGRLMADNIICCGYEKQEIREAIRKALGDEFGKNVRCSKSLYGEGETSKKIVEILENIEINEILLKKKLIWER